MADESQRGEPRIVLFLYAIASVFMVVSILMRRHDPNVLDVLKETKIHSLCDGWCLLHLVLYFCLGFFAPNYWKTYFFIGLVWEGFELLAEQFHLVHISFNKYDPLINALGIGLGVMFSKFVNTPA